MGFAMGAFFSSMGPTMSGLPDPSEVRFLHILYQSKEVNRYDF